MTGTRWLDDEEQEAWRTYLYGSRVLLDSLDRHLQREAGMPHTYYGILAALSEAPERSLTMTQLAELTRASPSKVSHAMNRLEDRGWVRRRRCSSNARQILGTLTDQGYDILVEAAPRLVSQVRNALFDVLSPGQVTQLRDIFHAVLVNLEDRPLGCDPVLAPDPDAEVPR